MRKLSAVLLLVCAATAGGQRAGGRQTPDSVVSRAIALANDQRLNEARDLIDSLVQSLPQTSPVYAEGLFWQGKLATTEQIAEEAYKKIVISFPLHRRAEESLILLANLEMMRGNRVQAQRYLDRVIVEHPYGSHRARASYWRARLFFEENELERGCAELGIARARIAPGDAELRTEIDYLAQSCRNVPVPAQPPPQRAGPPARDSAGRGGADARGQQQSRGRGRATEPPKVMYSVQAAAFAARESAQAFVDVLAGRGYPARVVDSAAPFRVRIGMFATREEAAVLAAELKSKRIASDAFVVEAEPR